MQKEEARRPGSLTGNRKTPSAHRKEAFPPQRNIVDAFTDTVLSVAYYGRLEARRGNYDSHMDEVREGEYEF